MIRILSFGDLFLGGRIVKEHRYSTLFSADLLDYLKRSDFRIANLESPIMNTKDLRRNHSPWPKKLLQVAPEYMVGLLKYLNIDFVSLANNHMFDYGEKGLLQTLRYLDDYQIQHSGAGLSLMQATQPANIEIKGLKIEIYSFCEHNNDFLKMIIPANKNEYGVATINETNFSNLSKLEKNSALRILCLHWGRENLIFPSKYQIEFINKYKDYYDIILGNHSHVPMKVLFENTENKIVAFSHGNFIFDEFFYVSPAQIVEYWPEKYQTTYDLPCPVKKPTLKKWDKIHRTSLILEINIDEETKKIQSINSRYVEFNQRLRKINFLSKKESIELDAKLNANYSFKEELKKWEIETKDRKKRQLKYSFSFFSLLIFYLKRIIKYILTKITKNKL